VAPDEKVPPFLLLELRDLGDHIAPDNRRVVPGGLLKRGREASSWKFLSPQFCASPMAPSAETSVYSISFRMVLCPYL